MRKYLTLFFGFVLFFTSKTIQAQSFLNGSFEIWGSANSCEINSAPDNWVNYSVACQAFDEANFNLCPSTIPPSASDGNIYARACAGPDWQGGEGVYQILSNFNIGQAYSISFDYAGSNLYGGTDSVRWKIFINDTLVAQTPFCSSLQNTWSNYSVSFLPTQSVNKIGFRAYFINPSLTGTGSAGIDNIKLQQEVVTNVNAIIGKQNISIYPIPTESILNIQSNSNDEMEVLMMDLNFNELSRNRFKDHVSLSIDNFKSGMYICLIKKQGMIIYKKAIVKL